MFVFGLWVILEIYFFFFLFEVKVLVMGIVVIGFLGEFILNMISVLFLLLVMMSRLLLLEVRLIGSWFFIFLDWRICLGLVSTR